LQDLREAFLFFVVFFDFLNQTFIIRLVSKLTYRFNFIIKYFLYFFDISTKKFNFAAELNEISKWQQKKKYKGSFIK